ncbi:MAG: DUF3141 domain-containing protein, partial [Pseudomonadota bacterium]
DIAGRPFVQAAVTPAFAEVSRVMHPLRMQRALLSSRNPAARPLISLAEQARAGRRPVAPDNPFLQAERVWADLMEQSLDMMRDARDTLYEMTFFTVWGSPWARWFGRTHQPGRTLKNMVELRALPQVQSAIAHISSGGMAEAVIRMLILLAESRGNVRRDRLERSARMLTQDEPFRSLGVLERNRIIHEQTLVVHFEPDRAVETLPDLLPDMADRERAAAAAQFVPGAIDEMSPHTLEMLQRMRAALGLPPASVDVTEDPLAGGEGAGAAAE